MSRPRKFNETPVSLVPLTIRVHPEARRQLKSVSALEGFSMEEKARSVLYSALGLDQLPVVLESSVTQGA